MYIQGNVLFHTAVIAPHLHFHMHWYSSTASITIKPPARRLLNQCSYCGRCVWPHLCVRVSSSSCVLQAASRDAETWVVQSVTAANAVLLHFSNMDPNQLVMMTIRTLRHGDVVFLYGDLATQRPYRYECSVPFPTTLEVARRFIPSPLQPPSPPSTVNSSLSLGQVIMRAIQAKKFITAADGDKVVASNNLAARMN